MHGTRANAGRDVALSLSAPAERDKSLPIVAEMLLAEIDYRPGSYLASALLVWLTHDRTGPNRVNGRLRPTDHAGKTVALVSHGRNLRASLWPRAVPHGAIWSQGGC
ncbi:nitric oxide reductase activation protein [Allobranchiibius huperziae]|uniref:Nitric oxide reductase activation protein n=1 Tax=Allobranchiibius huperziae TaxID=1874116 RepID=A0A853DIL4_9MICO|nr:nitric oxide reductase activation protein [Allobranchiibius huperziae]